MAFATITFLTTIFILWGIFYPKIRNSNDTKLNKLNIKYK